MKPFAFVLMAFLSSATQASVVFYSDSMEFAGATEGIPLTIEAFEPPPSSRIVSNTLEFDSLTLTGIGGSVSHVDVASTSSVITTAGDGWVSFTTPTVLEIVFDEPTHVFGIDLYDVLERAHATLTFEILLDTGALGFVVQETGDVGLPSSNFLFVGLISSTSFTRMLLSQTAPLEEDVIFIDRIRSSSTIVPEPSTLGLLGAGLFGLVVLRRKRTRSLGSR